MTSNENERTVWCLFAVILFGLYVLASMLPACLVERTVFTEVAFTVPTKIKIIVTHRARLDVTAIIRGTSHGATRRMKPTKSWYHSKPSIGFRFGNACGKMINGDTLARN